MTTPTRPGDALSETQRRFLVAVMQRLPRELVHEIYLFAPMKQGGVETGIAVVAIGEPLETTADADADAEHAAIDEVDAEHVEIEHVEIEHVEIEHAAMDHGDAEHSDAERAIDDEEAVALSAPVRAARFTIHTARYRLQLKGPERGKWDVDVVEEADAPLVTVDAVVRGVHRRSGEPSEVERLAPHDLARALGEIPWTSEN